MNASQRKRLERIEKLLAPPSAPPLPPFRIVSMVDWPLDTQRAYEAASDAGDAETCDALLERFEGIPRPVPLRRRRYARSRHQPRATTLIISQILDEPEPEGFEDEPPVRVGRDGVSIVVTSPQNPPALDPDEIVGHDPFGYSETRAQRTERLKRQSGYAAFDRAGRQL